MTHSLSFDSVHDYAGEAAISVPVALRFAGEIVRVDAFVDTGATFCVFKREHAASLAIDVESGTSLRVGTVTGSFDAYGHTVTLETLGYLFESIIYFAAHDGLPYNVLGRRGWLDRIRLGLVEYESRLFLSRYGEP